MTGGTIGEDMIALSHVLPVPVSVGDLDETTFELAKNRPARFTSVLNYLLHPA